MAKTGPLGPQFKRSDPVRVRIRKWTRTSIWRQRPVWPRPHRFLVKNGPFTKKATDKGEFFFSHWFPCTTACISNKTTQFPWSRAETPLYHFWTLFTLRDDIARVLVTVLGNRSRRGAGVEDRGQSISFGKREKRRIFQFISQKVSAECDFSIGFNLYF